MKTKQVSQKYDDVQIKNCQLDTVNRWGIAVGYTYNWDKIPDSRTQ